MTSEREKASDKVKTICRLITEETLVPAKKEAQETISIARREAELIIEEAKKEARLVQERCDRDVAHKISVMQASLDMAVKQAITFLKQEVTEHFFSKELHHMLTKELQSSAWVTKLLDGIVQALDREGTKAELNAVVPRTTTKEEILQSLTKGVAERLRRAGESGVTVGNLNGVEVKPVGENFTLNVTEEALYQILAKYIHRDLKEKIFKQ